MYCSPLPQFRISEFSYVIYDKKAPAYGIYSDFIIVNISLTLWNPNSMQRQNFTIEITTTQTILCKLDYHRLSFVFVDLFIFLSISLIYAEEMNESKETG